MFVAAPDSTDLLNVLQRSFWWGLVFAENEVTSVFVVFAFAENVVGLSFSDNMTVCLYLAKPRQGGDSAIGPDPSTQLLQLSDADNLP